MSTYHARLHITDGENCCWHVDVPTEKGERPSRDEIESRARALAVKAFGSQATSWPLIDFARNR